MTSLSADQMSTLDSPISMHLCSKCGKPFTNERSRDRHVRYCGSRARRRQRSCLACGAAKSKCSFEMPCARCTQKGIKCVSSNAISTSTASVGASVTRDSREASTTVASEIPTHTLDDEERETFQDSRFMVMHDLLVGEGENSLVDHSNHVAAGIITQHSPLIGLVEIEQQHIPSAIHGDHNYQSLSGMTVNSHHGQDTHAPIWCKWTRQGLCLATDALSNISTSRSGRIAQITQTPAQHNADVIIQSLRAFPTMMLRKETWPWFVHPHSHLLLGSPNTTLPEALAACMAIAQMYVLGTNETKPFVWQTIRTECRRFTERLHLMSEFELVTATQACMVYFIMCIVEASPENDAICSELLQILYDLYGFSKRFYGGHTYECELARPSSNWAEWIFAESRRRLTLLWFLVGCVVRVKMDRPHDLSQSHRTLPLPAPKPLWEASSESMWRSEYEASRILQASGLVCLGDLIDAQSSRHLSVYNRKLDLWNASADNLGVLLNLTHTMV